MNVQLHQRWTEWRRLSHLQALTDHGRLLAQHNEQKMLCEQLQGYLQEYDQQSLSGEAMDLLDVRARLGFAGQVHQVHVQQREQARQLGNHLALARQQIQQRQAQLEQLQMMLQMHLKEQQRLQERQDQSLAQEWASQRPSAADGH